MKRDDVITRKFNIDTAEWRCPSERPFRLLKLCYKNKFEVLGSVLIFHTEFEPKELNNGFERFIKIPLSTVARNWPGILQSLQALYHKQCNTVCKQHCEMQAGNSTKIFGHALKQTLTQRKSQSNIYIDHNILAYLLTYPLRAHEDSWGRIDHNITYIKMWLPIPYVDRRN